MEGLSLGLCLFVSEVGSLFTTLSLSILCSIAEKRHHGKAALTKENILLGLA